MYFHFNKMKIFFRDIYRLVCGLHNKHMCFSSYFTRYLP
jgi:hypothetical protein